MTSRHNVSRNLSNFCHLNFYLDTYEPEMRAFRLKVWSQNNPKHSWFIYRRYSEFLKLYQEIDGISFGYEFPPKLFNLISLNDEAIDKRKQGLIKFCTDVLKNPFLNSFCPVVHFFFETDINEENLTAVKRAKMIFQCQNKFSIGNEIAIGWRWNKFYLNCQHIKEKSSLIASMCAETKNFETFKIDIVTFTKFIKSFDPQFIFSPIDVLMVNSSIYIYRFVPLGSLADKIYQNYNPKENYYKKLVSMNNKNGLPLCAGEIITYGEQILNALIYLHKFGIYHGNIHSGNILLDGNAKITDTHSSLLDYTHRDMKFFMSIAEIENEFQIDILGFGTVLYEMIYGQFPSTSFEPAIGAFWTNYEIEHFLRQLVVNKKISHTCTFDIEIRVFKKKFIEAAYEIPTVISNAYKTLGQHLCKRILKEQQNAIKFQKQLDIHGKPQAKDFEAKN